METFYFKTWLCLGSLFSTYPEGTSFASESRPPRCLFERFQILSMALVGAALGATALFGGLAVFKKLFERDERRIFDYRFFSDPFTQVLLGLEGFFPLSKTHWVDLGELPWLSLTHVVDVVCL